MALGKKIIFEAEPKFSDQVEAWWEKKSNKFDWSKNRYKSYPSGAIDVTVIFKLIPHYVLFGVFIIGLITAFLTAFLFNVGGFWTIIGALEGSIVAPALVCLVAIKYDEDSYGKSIIICLGVFCIDLLAVGVPGFVYYRSADAHIKKLEYDIAIKDYNRYD